MRQRIEDDPKALTEFKRRATKTDGPIIGIDAQARGAFQTLTNGEFSVDEQTLVELGGQDLLQEIRLLSGRYGELATEILIPTVVLAPHISTSSERGARIGYQLTHFDLMDSFASAFHMLERERVSVRRGDISPELAAWAEAQLTDPRTAPRIRRHFDLRPLEVPS
jgi:hypothetical protein